MDGLTLWRILASGLCLGGVFAFQNEFFAALEEDLLAARQEVVVRRARQAPEEGEPDHHHGHHHHHHWRRHMGKMMCCGDEKTMDHKAMAEKYETMRACFKDHHRNSSHSGDPLVDMFSCDRIKERKHEHICIADCTMKKSGVIDDDGVIDIDKVKEYNNKFVAEDWMNEVSNAAVEKCANSKEMVIEDEASEGKCNAAAINFKHCMWKEIVMTCPEEHQKNNRFCERMRTAFQEKENNIN